MRVFISWSGERSKYVASSLQTWFKQVIQAVRRWMSSESILAGQRWSPEITENLAQTKFGVICLTPENIDSHWLNFEAGALSKAVDNNKNFVCPYLICDARIDARHPLSQFQHKPATKGGTLDIVLTMHKALTIDQSADLTEAQVRESFDN